MESIARMVMFAGAALVVAGAVLFVLARLTGGFIPGDIVIRRDNFTFVFPVVTMIILSVVLTILLNLFLRR